VFGVSVSEIRNPQSEIHGRPKAALLLGPTASGKTPLGDLLESRGLRGRRCVHFDFGARLRLAAEAGPGFGRLDAADLAVIRRSLETGALLENETFPVAGKIFRAFAQDRALSADVLLVLNGLPRHAGQAGDTASLVRVETVVHLRCDADAVRARIRSNAGGDRTGREDDSPGAVEAKLRLFRERSLPLLDFYRARGAQILTLDVGAQTGAGELYAMLESAL
jgi:adenylate kinase family enzyme